MLFLHHVLLNGYKVWEDLKSAPFPRPTHATVWILNNVDNEESNIVCFVVFVYLFIQLLGFSISLSISNILDNSQRHYQ